MLALNYLLKAIKLHQRILLTFAAVQSNRTLVFVNKKKTADDLSEFLSEMYKNVWVLHGDIEQAHRVRALDAFRDDPKAVLVATDVASRGLDIKELACVINYDMPGQIAQYVHRIGRTGRAGQRGFAVSFVRSPLPTTAPPSCRR